MTLEKVSDQRRVLTLVECKDAPLRLLVCNGQTVMTPQVLDPVRTVIALDPAFGVVGVLHESPAPGAVAPPYATQLAHLGKKALRIRSGDLVLDRDHDRTGIRQLLVIRSVYGRESARRVQIQRL